MATTPKKSTAREYFEAILYAVILALFIRTWIFQAFKIPTGSMEPNLLIGDHLLVNKFVYAPTATAFERALLPVGEVARGDILVFKFPEEPERDFIKRVVGLPGERLELRDGVVWVDGNRLDESYLIDRGLTPLPGAIALDRRGNYGPVVIPGGHYFMMGDNRGNSQDSRWWGALPHENLKGRATVIYWSFDGAPELMTETGLGATLRRLFSVFTSFFSGTRWDRMFHQVR